MSASCSSDASMTPRFPRLLLLCPILASALLSGCVEMEPREERPPAAAIDAEQLYQQGDLDGAARAFEKLAAERSDQRDHYRLRAAEAYREEGNLEAAAQALAGIKARRLSPDEATRLALLN